MGNARAFMIDRLPQEFDGQLPRLTVLIFGRARRGGGLRREIETLT
jgi:hypothetical protein